MYIYICNIYIYIYIYYVFERFLEVAIESWHHALTD